MPIPGGYASGVNNGVQNTSQPPHADIIKKDFGQTILRYQRGGSAPIFAMLSAMQTGTADNVEHGYYGKGMLLPSGQMNGAKLAADTTFTMDDTSQLLPGDVIAASYSGEKILVETVVSATQITVRRAVGSVAAANIADDTVLVKVGSASEEASGRPGALSWNPIQFKNYTQIFRTGWAVSGTASQIQHIVGDGQVAENKADCMHLHSQAMELSILFGDKYTGTRNGKPFRTMQGILHNLKEAANYPADLDGTVHHYVVGDGSAGSVTWAALQTPLESTLDVQMLNAMNTERYVYCGKTFMQIINEVVRKSGEMQLQTGQNRFGMQIRTLVTARGTFMLIEHPVLNMRTDWAKLGFVLNLSTLRLVYLGNRKTQSKTYGMMNGSLNQVHDNSLDAVGGDLLTEMTMEHLNSAANAVIELNGTAGAS